MPTKANGSTGEMLCSVCGRIVKAKKPASRRLPKGWKNHQERLYCGACLRKNFILRAVTLPVAGPLDGTWDELNAILRIMFIRTTQISNWMMTQLYARDVRRTTPPPLAGEQAKDADKMPPPKHTYLYPEARPLFPELPPQSVAAIEQAVTRKYNARAMRYKVNWTAQASLPVFRYPTPFPVHNQSWSVLIENNFPVVSARMGDAWIRFRLHGGVRYRRQISAVLQIVSGTAVPGEMALYRQGTDLLCKMAAWLPRRENTSERIDALTVRTATDALVETFNVKDERVWTYHGDHLVRLIARHRAMLQRLADDSKAESRPVPPFAERRRRASAKMRHRLKTDCQTIAAMIAKYAVRRRFRLIRYDDTERSFCVDFTWYQLKQYLSQKCDELGLEFEYTGASGETVEELTEPLAE